MAWLDGTVDREYDIQAPLQEVADYFGDPEQFGECIKILEELTELGEDRWKFTLTELSVKSISFQPEYRVEYERDGDVITWQPTGDVGNLKAEGRIELDELDEDRTRVHYQETMSVKLPVPGLMTGVFEPIVSDSVEKGVGDMLDCAKRTLESDSEA